MSSSSASSGGSLKSGMALEPLFYFIIIIFLKEKEVECARDSELRAEEKKSSIFAHYSRVAVLEFVVKVLADVLEDRGRDLREGDPPALGLGEAACFFVSRSRG